MIYDAILFYNELDLLEIRLNILNDYVDYFVITEATETFMGKTKPLYFKENIERFSKWRHKIIHQVVDDFPNNKLLYQFCYNSPNVGNKEHFWVREMYQKESMIFPLKENCKDNDIVYVSDLDEIWNPEIQIKVKWDTVYRPIQTPYIGYLNNRISKNTGVGTRFGAYKTLKKYGINYFRTEREVVSIPIEKGGWHFTFMGGIEMIKTKLQSYSHQEYNNDTIKNNIDSNIQTNVDFLNRGYTVWQDESDLPKYILDNKIDLKLKGLML